MPETIQSLGIDRLSVSERLELISAIWDTIPDVPATPEWHRIELDRRIADADANPETGIPWEDVKQALRKPS